MADARRTLLPALILVGLACRRETSPPYPDESKDKAVDVDTSSPPPAKLVVTMSAIARYRLASNVDAGVYDEQVYFTPSTSYAFPGDGPSFVQLRFADGREIDVGVRSVTLGDGRYLVDCIAHQGWRYDLVQLTTASCNDLLTSPTIVLNRSGDEQIELRIDGWSVLSAGDPTPEGATAAHPLARQDFEDHGWFASSGVFARKTAPSIAVPLLFQQP
jgi:hypothetical protein